MKIEITQNNDFDTIASMVEEVQNLHAQLYPTIYKSYQYMEIKYAMEKFLADENNQLWVAQLDDKPVGYLFLMLKHIAENAFYFSHKILHIDQLSVLTPYQHIGVGSMLINKAESIAIEMSITRIELDYLHLNTKAASFFKRKGFEPYRAKLYKTVSIN